MLSYLGLMALNTNLPPGSQLVKDLGHELGVLQGLPRLHDPDDGRLDEELPVLLDVFFGQFNLLLLLNLHRNVDVYPELLVLVAVEQVDGSAGVNHLLVHLLGYHQKLCLEDD